MRGRLILKTGEIFEGLGFGAIYDTQGELVFTTGMVGYPEALTDPSYRGQILVFSYPLIGNYGVPDDLSLESSSPKVAGVVVCQYIESRYHFQAKKTLGDWLKDHKIPGLMVDDTRFLVKNIRNRGSLPARITFETGHKLDFSSFEELNEKNLVSEVSIRKPVIIGQGKKTIAIIDCGMKENLKRILSQKNFKLIIVPWNYDIFELKEKVEGVVISNGPGDPKALKELIENVKKIIKAQIPILGICLGHQILALACGGDTFKLPYGHRGQNQPCLDLVTKRCYITSQNHGFAVSKLPKNFLPWFINLNDSTNEGMFSQASPFYSVQFHPEASAGPNDTLWIIDYFLKRL